MTKQALYSLSLPRTLESRGGISIKHRDHGPVLTLAALDTFLDAGTVEKLGQNLVSVLNGHAPLHTDLATGGHKLHYSRASDGAIMLRMKKADEPGVTRPVLGIYATDGSKGPETLRRLDQAVMRTLCDGFTRASAPAAQVTAAPRSDGPAPRV